MLCPLMCRTWWFENLLLGFANLLKLTQVDLGLGMTIVGLEQLLEYFDLLLTLLPSYLRSSICVYMDKDFLSMQLLCHCGHLLGLCHLVQHCSLCQVCFIWQTIALQDKFLLKRRKEIVAENFSECSLSMGAECASLVSRWFLFLLTENYVFLFPAPWCLPWGQCWSIKRRTLEISFCN